MIWIIVGTTGITLLVLLIVGCVEKARETDYEDKAKELDGQYGKLTKEIAYERGSSIHTINSHRKNIFRKLNVNCAHDAIKYALRAGLVDQAEFYI